MSGGASQRRTRWSRLTVRSRVTLIGGFVLFVAGTVLYAFTNSSAGLLIAVAGLFALRLIGAVGAAASRGRRRPPS